MAKITDKSAAEVNRASLPESHAARHEPGKLRRKSQGRAKNAGNISSVVVEQDVEVETEIINEEPSYEQRDAYDRFWQLFFQRIITRRSSHSPKSIAKPEE